jgi:prepilin-type N-terminal cleavage/methylation domain-containing protein
MVLQYKKSAFTLAEVLITLLIIGVVASLVIPNIINDSKEAEYNAGVKKVYSDLSNALKMALINNGGSINVGSGNSTAARVLLRNDFCNIMTCTKFDTIINIFGPADYKYYKGGYIGYPSTGDNSPSAILNNGYFLVFGSYENCNYNGISACGYLRVDINGSKGPNMIGKDLYTFHIIKQENGPYTLLPRGTKGDTSITLPDGCIPGASAWSSTEGCTAKRLIDPDHMP